MRHIKVITQSSLLSC